MQSLMHFPPELFGEAKVVHLGLPLLLKDADIEEGHQQ